MKTIPEFKSEEDERKFWAADSTVHIDWSSAKRRKRVRLKPSLKAISLRLPVSMIEDLKVLANSRDVPYQSLLKVFLAARQPEYRSPLFPGGRSHHRRQPPVAQVILAPAPANAAAREADQPDRKRHRVPERNQ